MLFKYILLLLVVSLISGCISFVKPKVKKHTNSYLKSSPQLVTHHHVKAGETLYSIAFEYGRDHRDIARWNRIKKPYTIYPKQKLRIVPISTDKKIRIKTNKVIFAERPSQKFSPRKTKNNYLSNKKLKWQWPTKGKIVSTFSMRDPGRRGIDIVGRRGQAVNAAATGQVVYRGNGLRGYGNLIIIKHNDTYFSAYAHTENVVVKEGEKVKLGQRIADMGNTGSNKIKLHFEIRRNGKPIDPLKHMPKRH